MNTIQGSFCPHTFSSEHLNVLSYRKDAIDEFISGLEKRDQADKDKKKVGHEVASNCHSFNS